MSTKQDRSLVLFAMLAGLIGGILASSLFMAVPVLAGKKQERIDAKTIIAEAIEAKLIVLRNDSDSEGVAMGITHRGLALSGKNGKELITIRITDNGTPEMLLHGKEGKSFAVISVDEKPLLGLTGKDETSTILLSVDPGDSSVILAGGQDRRPTASLWVKNGSPALQLFGKEGAIHAEVADPKNTFLAVLGADEKFVWKVP